jgi:hypothetical protein
MSSITRTYEDTRIRNRTTGGQRARRPAIQAESLIRINSDFGQIVRESKIKNGQFTNFDPETTQITLLDAHNALINYLKHVLPKKIPGCLNTQTGVYRLCPTLKKMFKVDFFNPTIAQVKWRMIMENVIHPLGQSARSTSTTPTTTPTTNVDSPDTTPATPLQYEPAPVNIARQKNNENLRRKRLRTAFQGLDEAVGKSETENTNSGNTGHWHYPEENTTSETSCEPENKKVQLDPEQTCVICMENRRTHAFLHAGLSSADVTAHFVACQKCANSCYWAEKGCPCCRTPVINIIRIIK